MTDPDDLDELASAHLDGATTPEEAARIAADPRLLARVDELRAVRAAVGEAGPPVDPARRDAAIAAALAAYEADATAVAGTRAPVTALAPVAARRGLSPRSIRLLGAAAAVAVAAALVPLVARLAESDDDRASFEATGDALGSSDAEGGRDAPEAAESPASTTTAVDPPTYVGSYPDVEELAAVLREDGGADGSEAGGYVATADDADACVQVRTQSAVENGGRSVATARARVDGTPVVAFVITTASGDRRLLVVRADDCTRLAEVAL